MSKEVVWFCSLNHPSDRRDYSSPFILVLINSPIFKKKKKKTSNGISHRCRCTRKAKIKKSDNTNSWWECGAVTSLLHCWWEWEMGKLCLENKLAYPYDVKHVLITWHNSATLRYFFRGKKFFWIYIYTKTCTGVVKTALCKTPQVGNNPNIHQK